MPKGNGPPLALGVISESHRGALEQMELAEPAAPGDGAANGIKADSKHSFRDKPKIEPGSIRFRRPL